MRVLFTTTGGAGHLLPLVPIAEAVRGAGHEVCVATQRPRVDHVTRVGLTPRPFDAPPDGAWQAVMASTAGLGMEEANERVVGELFADLDTRAALPRLLDTVDSWRPDVIVSEGYEFAGGLAAELRGLPQVRVGLGLAGTDAWAAGVAAPALARLRAELELPNDPRAERLLASPYLTCVPSELEDPQVPGPTGAARFRAPGAGPAPPLPAWWPADDDRPLVYLSFGSVAGGLGHFPDLYRGVIDALSSVPARLLVTTGHGGQPSELGRLPPNVHVERWIPQHQVLGHAEAVISHGGFGTTMAALARGLPLILLPLFASDQWQLARRVAEIGAGIALPSHPEPGRRAHDPPGRDALASLPDALQRVLDDDAHGDAARSVASAMAALAPVDAAVGLLAASLR